MSLNTIVEASGAPRLKTVLSMGLDGVGVFSIYSGLSYLAPCVPIFKGGITTTEDDGFDLWEEEADGGLGISILPEFFGVLLANFFDETFLFDNLPLLLVLRLEVLDEGILISSLTMLLAATDDIFEWSSFNEEVDDFTDVVDFFFESCFAADPLFEWLWVGEKSCIIELYLEDWGMIVASAESS